MAKFMDGLYKYFTWIILLLSMLAYFAYQVLDFEGSIEKTLLDWQTWVHVAFVMFLQVTMVDGAFDSGTYTGLGSEEFNLADKLNNKIITSVNNEMEDFRGYVKRLNQHELQNLRDDYLFKVGDKEVKDLTKKELKEYNKLKPLRHDIYGFNLPLYYEISKNGQVKYQASVKKNEGKRTKKFTKLFTGILFAGMTVNVVFSLNNVGDAFISLLIIGVGLVLTYLLTFFPQVFKFKNDLPKKVILKKTLYDSYTAYKTGTHTLKELKEEVPEIIEAPERIEAPEIIEAPANTYDPAEDDAEYVITKEVIEDKIIEYEAKENLEDEF